MVSQNEALRLVQMANDRLRAGGCRVKLEMQGKDNWLHLRGTFPPKPGDVRTRPYQTKHALKMRAMDRESIRQAELIAKQIDLDLNLGNFDWRKFTDFDDPGAITTQKLTAILEKQWWAGKNPNDTSAQNSWRIYRDIMKRLPDVEMSQQVLTDWIIINSDPNTGMRLHYARIAMMLAEIAEMPDKTIRELKVLRGKKIDRPINPRSLPTDTEIVAFRNSVKDPGWQYLVGLQAAYGLRNHECFFLDYSDFPIVRVREDTKTGARPVKPLLKEWAALWQLDKVIYPERLQIEAGMSSAQLGDKISSHFAPKGWKPYNLRHAYARRCMEKGLRPDLAAKLMGHGLFLHTTTYRAWITESEYLAMVDEILDKE